VIIRRAIVGDAAQIVATVREGFTDDQLQLFVYGCDGIERYLKCELELPSHLSAGVYLVAEQEGAVTGCAQFLSRNSTLFLNYISVVSRHRGRGIGAALLMAGIARFSNGAGSLSLDVFSVNSRAQHWYLQLGLSKTDQTDYLEVKAPQRPDVNFRVDGWTQAEVCHAAFAFSSFTVTTDVGCHSIGRLGSRWFRITNASALADPGVWSALRTIDPARGTLALLDAGGVCGEAGLEVRSLASTVRLSGPLPTVRARLSEEVAPL
jgi:ribosomal protein S18 acetylase RimI-like enzyme